MTAAKIKNRLPKFFKENFVSDNVDVSIPISRIETFLYKMRSQILKTK